jgi:hypothetical protein
MSEISSDQQQHEPSAAKVHREEENGAMHTATNATNASD